MLQRILEQKNALVEYASFYDIPVMTANQWKLANTLVTTLTRFEELTRQASSASESTSMVTPSVLMLQRSLQNHTDDQGIQTLTSTMLESLNRRFKEMESKNCLSYLRFWFLASRPFSSHRPTLEKLNQLANRRGCYGRSRFG